MTMTSLHMAAKELTRDKAITLIFNSILDKPDSQAVKMNVKHF